MRRTQHLHIVIVGGGIAGASLAAALASRCNVTLVEAEDQPGRHATGRSAAMYLEGYGNAAIRALTRASRAFLSSPPDGFCITPLLSPRSLLFVADNDQTPRLDAMLEELSASGLRRLTAGAAVDRVPILSHDWISAAALDENGFDIDVAALLQAYLALARRSSARIITGAGLVVPKPEADGWTVRTSHGELRADIVVNAAGAWADTLATSAGVAARGLRPLRRTAITIKAPASYDPTWPMVMDAAESFYFKPDAGQLLLSPANEDPELPGDTAPDEMDVAIAIDRFETSTTERVRSIAHRWAGLRTFAPDRTPVVGYDAAAPGFFWLAGQGGYGIQTAPAMAALAASLILNEPVPEEILFQGVNPGALDANRPSLQPAADTGGMQTLLLTH